MNHFRSENKPIGAGDRCVDCSVEKECPYSAKRIYIEGNRFTSAIIDGKPTHEKIVKAVEDGPYGRCVYSCDNDVCDNQVVNLQFEDGKSASFTMIAFTRDVCIRKTRVFGTKGELIGDGLNTIHLFDFVTLTNQTFFVSNIAPVATKMTNHEYADWHLMNDFIEALLTGDRARVLSGPREVC